MPSPFRFVCLFALVGAVASGTCAQSSRVRVPAVAPAAPPAAAGPVSAPPKQVPPTAPTPAVAALALPQAPACAPPTASPNLTVTYVGALQIDLAWTPPTPPSGCALDYYELSCTNQDIKPPSDTPCGPKFKNLATQAIVAQKITATTFSDTGLQSENYYNYQIIAFYKEVNTSDTPVPDSQSPPGIVYAVTARFTCLLIPTRPACMNFGGGIDSNINAFWQTSGSYTFFGQVKSIYNGASSSATISADLGTLNFGNGMQVTVTTNAQAGSAGVTAVNAGTAPTLSSKAAGQATQNMLFGGTFLISELYPLLAVGASKLNSAGGLGISLDFIAKEGVDIQNFASGTNVNVTSPPFHGSGQLETYVQYNSINFLPSSQNLAGSIFVGGTYGYSYTSPAYLRNYGFAGKQNNGIGQVSVGIVLNTVATISFSRGFGPSQTYIDSTTMTTTSVNNFKAWSIGVTYQTATPSNKK